MARQVKRLRNLSLIVVALVIILAPALSVVAEEVITLTTVMPGQDTLRVKRGAVGLTYKSLTDAQIGNSNLLIEGNVGIGMTGPNSTLDILSETARTGSHATSLGLYVTANSSPAAGGVEFRHYNGTQGIGFGYNTIYATGSNTNQNLILQSRGTSPLTLNASVGGNVGIGTASPGYKLEVVANTSAWGTRFSNSAGTNNYVYMNHSTNGMHIRNDSTPAANYLLDVYPSNAKRFQVRGDGTVTALGKVGIGITAPQAKLHIGGTSGTDGIMFPDGTLQTTAGGGAFGSWTNKNSAGGALVKNTVYRVSSNGFVCAYITTSNRRMDGYTDGNASPATVRFVVASAHAVEGNPKGSFTMPVKNGDYWKITGDPDSIYWLPMGSGKCVRQ